MQTTTYEHFTDGEDPTINRTLNILTLFEDIPTGKRGKQVYDYLSNHLSADFRFNHQLWKLSVLGTPMVRELAAKDAAEADILIFSVHGDDELAPEVKSWLDVWIGQRGTPIALVALFDPENKHSEPAIATRRYLQEVAHFGQMDFFTEPEQEVTAEAAELASQQRFDFEDGFGGVSAEEIGEWRTTPRWGIND
jgi:hypothetical protein